MKCKSTLLNLKKHILFFCISIFLFSCGSKQDIVYFQNIDLDGLSKSINNYNSIIVPADMLSISVSALDQDAARPFNLPTSNFSLDGSQGREQQQTYLVDNNGQIDFPVLGKLKIAGLNRIQCTEMIKDLLKDYIKNPIVNVRIENFKVTVLGEVNNPGSYTVPNERITILEVLGLAGDLTIHAERKNILVIREENNVKVYHRVDLTSTDFFNSTVYYLAQNDVVYVEPNNSRVKSSTVGPNVNATLSVISTLLGTVALIVSITTIK